MGHLYHFFIARRCGRFAAVSPAAGHIDRLLHNLRPAVSSSRAAAAEACGGRMRAVPRCQLT